MDFLLLATLLLGHIPNQAPAATLIGTIVDVESKGIPGAVIRLSGPELRTAVSDPAGKYAITGLAPGTYAVSANQVGFQPASTVVTLGSSQTAVWNPRLLTFRLTDAESLEEFVELLTGSSAKNCGRHTLPTSPQVLAQVMQCARESIAATRPFYAALQVNGIDSTLVRGLLSRPNGATYRFEFDQHPCGGLSCYPRFSIARCPEPYFAGTATETDVLCRLK